MPLLVLSAGYGTTVQDCGRVRFRKFGAPVAGALDSATLRVLNLLVGNAEDTAALEVSSGRIRLQFTDNRLVAWSGGDFEVRAGPVKIPALHCARILPQEVCEISARRGRAWLAISGGLDVPVVLGSRSTDLRAGFGGLAGRALRDDDELRLGDSSEMTERIREQISGVIADWSGPQLSSSPAQRSAAKGSGGESLQSRPRDLSASLEMAMRIIRAKESDDELLRQLVLGRFTVAMTSDRMGLRLESANINTSQHAEIVSEAVVPGTIQLPPGGAPIVLLADCQTIGGYPKIAHVITVDLARAAQLQPMDKIRFELTTLEHARSLLSERERDIALFRAGLAARFG